MIYFTPGPSQLNKNIAGYLSEAIKDEVGSISHRSETYMHWHKQAILGVRKLLDLPASHRVFFLSSSLESMERILQNTVTNSSLHVTCGAFSKKWYEMALLLGKSPTQCTFADGQPVENSIIRSHMSRSTELLCITQNETSTGLCMPTTMIHSLKKAHPNVLLAVDMVSSAPYPRLNYRLVDLSFFSVQKGMGLPAGLGVLTISPQAFLKSQKLEKRLSTGSYHSFSSLRALSDKYQTPETPNVLNIYLLGKVLGCLNKIGREKIQNETDQKAQLIYNFFAKNPQMGSPFVSDPQFRSPTTLMFKVGAKQQKILNALKKKEMIIGRGYGEKYKYEYIRIANFPQHSLSMVKKLLKALDRIKS